MTTPSASGPGAAELLFVLGAADPEMRAIERLLAAQSAPFVYATADGKRVYPANAYRGELPESALEAMRNGGALYVVECVDRIPAGAVRIDHHRPGDPGYGQPPVRFWEASSLGQTVAALALARGHAPPVTPEMRMIAAADHCLGAAYQGQCPGVDPDALMRMHVAARAAFEHRSESAVRDDIDAACSAIRSAPRVELADGVYAADLRDRIVAELPLAAAREAQCCLSAVRARDGRTKIGCLVGSPVQIATFMDRWAPAQHLVEIYGDAARGFAGAYAPEAIS